MSREGCAQRVLFREEQRPRQWWVRLVVMAASVGAVLAAPPIGLLVAAALLWLYAVTRLTTEVRADGLYIRYFPFHLSFHEIPLEGVVECRAVRYRPMRQYGGWGIRYARGGKAYNVSGDLAVRLDYENGRHLLIGSRRPEEFEEALCSLAHRRRR